MYNEFAKKHGIVFHETELGKEMNHDDPSNRWYPIVENNIREPHKRLSLWFWLIVFVIAILLILSMSGCNKDSATDTIKMKVLVNGTQVYNQKVCANVYYYISE